MIIFVSLGVDLVPAVASAALAMGRLQRSHPHPYRVARLGQVSDRYREPFPTTIEDQVRSGQGHKAQ